MGNMQGLRPGVMLRHDTYRILRMLGQGGFGITYLATDLSLDRLVAIKEFFPKDYCDRDATTSHVTLGSQSATEFVNKLKAKFLKEARNIAKLDHPGIIKIHAAFEENNTAYYVMDYIEGESLSEMVKKHGLLPEAKAVEYIRKVGGALEYVHSKSINHLDIKPANIMVRRSDDNPVLIDFGLSKQYDSSGSQTSTTPTGISHGYAPMEQYNDGGVREFSPQTDLYSLAATLYYLLSGITPPQATKLIENELTFPEAIPMRLIGPISKAMSPTRRERHETVRKFISDITNAKAVNDDTVIVERAKQTPNLEPAPKPIPNPAPNPNPTPTPNPTSQPKSKRNLYFGVGAAAAVTIAIMIFAFIGGKESSADAVATNDTTVVATDAITPAPTVYDMYWKSSLGGMYYTGEVKIDPESGKKIPHGKGAGVIMEGKREGNAYEGQFVDGKMDGEAVYHLSNGDRYEGTFKNDNYYEGRYTFCDTGEYFVGTFKNGNPDKGQWYDSNGKEIEF